MVQGRVRLPNFVRGADCSLFVFADADEGGFQRAGHNRGAFKKQRIHVKTLKKCRRQTGGGKRGRARPNATPYAPPELRERSMACRGSRIRRQPMDIARTTVTRWRWRYALYKWTAPAALELSRYGQKSTNCSQQFSPLQSAEALWLEACRPLVESPTSPLGRQVV